MGMSLNGFTVTVDVVLYNDVELNGLVIERHELTDDKNFLSSDLYRKINKDFGYDPEMHPIKKLWLSGGHSIKFINFSEFIELEYLEFKSGFENVTVLLFGLDVKQTRKLVNVPTSVQKMRVSAKTTVMNLDDIMNTKFDTKVIFGPIE